MHMDASASTALSEPSRPNEFASLFTIFAAPKSTFAKMAESPRFLLALILCIVVISAFTVPIFTSGVVRDETVAKLEAKGAPEAQVQATAQFFDSPAGLWIGLGGNVIGIPFVMLLSSAVLFFMGNLMLGAKLRFPHYLSATVYGAVVGLVDYAVRSALVLAKQTTDVRLGVGNFFGDDLPYIGKVLDSATDPLLLWGTAITALGVAVYAKKGFGFGALASLPTFIIMLLLAGMR